MSRRRRPPPQAIGEVMRNPFRPSELLHDNIRMKRYDIIQAIDDDKLFAQHFRGDSWAAWRVFLRALFGLEMSPEELEVYKEHTERDTPPASQAREAWLLRQPAKTGYVRSIRYAQHARKCL